MGSFAECWGKHASGLSDLDRASVEARIQEHLRVGHSPLDAAKLAVQSHLEEAHAQLQSIYDQTIPKTPSVPETPVSATGSGIQKETASVTPETPAGPPTPVTETAPSTSLKNAVTAVERDTRGLSPREEVQRRSWDDAKAIADKQAASDPNIGARLVDELNKKPRALDDIEGAHLLQRKVEVNAEHDAAIKQLNANPEDVNAIARLKSARDELQKTYNAAEVSGTAWGRGGKIRQALMAEDFSPQAMEAKARAIGNKGKPLADDQLRRVADQHGKIAKQEASIRLTENDLQRPNGRMAPNEILSEIEKMKQRLTPCL